MTLNLNAMRLSFIIAASIMIAAVASCDDRRNFKSNAHSSCQDTISLTNQKILNFNYDEESFADAGGNGRGQEITHLVLRWKGGRVFEADYICEESENGNIAYTSRIIYTKNQ